MFFGCFPLSGVAANCASALAQMAAASCVQEEKEDKEVAEMGDSITQGTEYDSAIWSVKRAQNVFIKAALHKNPRLEIRKRKFSKWNAFNINS